MTNKTAIITGITGQDGAYLTELLLGKGYKVFGTYRRTSSVNFWRLEEVGVAKHPNLELVEYDLTDLGTTIAMVQRVQPDEIYNLAAQSFVGVSFEQPTTTAQITGVGALHILEAIRLVNPRIRFYQASTSEMFGKVQAIPREKTRLFGLVVHTASPSSTRIGLRSIIAKVTTSSVPAVSCSTTKALCGAANS